MSNQIGNKHASPPPPAGSYVFRGPAKVAIRTRTSDQPRYVDTRLNVWTWHDGGLAMKINWNKLQLNSELIEIGKGFIAYTLEKYAPKTVAMFVRTLRFLSATDLANGLPWEIDQLMIALEEIKKSRSILVGFRRLYRWAIDRGIRGFDTVTYLKIKEIKSDRIDPYARIFLSQSCLELDEEIRLLKRIEQHDKTSSWDEIQKNIMLHLGFELGPRAIQFHSLDIADFEVIESAGQERYYTLWLPMAKKIGQRRPERRPRKITSLLGERLRAHVFEVRCQFGNDCEALFVSASGKRLSVKQIGAIIRHELHEAGIDRSDQVTMLLRHNLGQGLADQGTPADIIAELLGHNSTVAARAYVTATPNIARIKEKALGKSPVYQRIMHSLLTGEVVPRCDSKPDRSVRGIIDTQYIGDIGACALPSHTNCPYNPVYACYTCKKFHPFADGRHELVKEALQREAQRFIDVAEQAGELINNRPLAQHQATIIAVSATIEHCRQKMEDAGDEAV